MLAVQRYSVPRMRKVGAEGLQNSGAGNFGLKRRILGVIAQTAEQDDEFVASETRNGFRFPDAAGELESDHLQQPVAIVVSEDTVERFEVVDVDQQTAPQAPVRAHGSDCLFQTVDQQPSVRQACRRAEERQLTHHLLGFSVCRQVDHRNNEMSDEAVVVFHCGNMQPRRVRFHSCADSVLLATLLNGGESRGKQSLIPDREEGASEHPASG